MASSRTVFCTDTNCKLQHHLYAPQGPYRDMQANQRMAKDFFIDENLRRFMQKRSEATLKTFSSTSLTPSQRLWLMESRCALARCGAIPHPRQLGLQ